MRHIGLMVWLLSARVVAAQAPFGIDGGDRLLAVDDDDDDDDGVRDAEQATPPLDDTLELSIGGRGAAELMVEGPVRLLGARAGTVRLPIRARVQGTDVGTAHIRVRQNGQSSEVRLRVLRMRFHSGDGHPLDARTDALRLARRVPNDGSLPLGVAARSGDAADVRVEILGELGEEPLFLTSRDGTSMRAARPLTLDADGYSAWFRLVGDRTDEAAPGIGHRVLLVALRDHVEVRAGDARQSLRVGRPGHESGPLAARRAELRIQVLRHEGVPVIGGSDARARELAEEQVSIANEVWLQCLVDFRAHIEVVDAPRPMLLAISDAHGLPSRGGTIRFRAGEVPIHVDVPSGLAPVDTALRVAAALSAAGLQPRVYANPRTDAGADASADVLARKGDAWVELRPDGAYPLTTDRLQSASIGVVDLSDGIREFQNANAASGTLEERALIHALGDHDASTIDVFVVNGFSSGTRQGEAFIESDGSALINTVLLDRNGIRQQRSAWTQSHELGHILMDQPFHPDNVGPDQPWLLMDSDTSLPLVTGPKRLTEDECARARDRSGAPALPELLRPRPE